MSLLELRDIAKSYGQGSAEVHALHEISLSADEGSMVAVMGPSGSGKSTLLTIAGTLEEPTSGKVLVGGSRSARWPAAPRRGCAAAPSGTSSSISTCRPA